MCFHLQMESLRLAVSVRRIMYTVHTMYARNILCAMRCSFCTFCFYSVLILFSLRLFLLLFPAGISNLFARKQTLGIPTTRVYLFCHAHRYKPIRILN